MATHARSMSETSFNPRPVTPAPAERPMSSPMATLNDSMTITVNPTPQTSPARAPKGQKLRKAELETILDCTFGAIEEIFHLTAPTNWLRNQGLHIVKNLLRNAYGSVISELIQSKLNSFVASENICYWLDTASGGIWPDEPEPDRTESEKLASYLEAKRLLLHSSSSTPLGAGIEKIQMVVGRYNTVLGMTRVTNMLQNQGLNQLLVFNLLEIIVQVSLNPEVA